MMGVVSDWSKLWGLGIQNGGSPKEGVYELIQSSTAATNLDRCTNVCR